VSIHDGGDSVECPPAAAVDHGNDSVIGSTQGTPESNSVSNRSIHRPSTVYCGVDGVFATAKLGTGSSTHIGRNISSVLAVLETC